MEKENDAKEFSKCFRCPSLAITKKVTSLKSMYSVYAYVCTDHFEGNHKQNIKNSQVMSAAWRFYDFLQNAHILAHFGQFHKQGAQEQKLTNENLSSSYFVPSLQLHTYIHVYKNGFVHSKIIFLQSLSIQLTWGYMILQRCVKCLFRSNSFFPCKLKQIFSVFP